MKRTHVVPLMLLILVFVIGAGCGSSSTTGSSTNTTQVPTANTSKTNTSAATNASANVNAAASDETKASVKEFDVVATQFEFTPGTLTVNEGDTVTLHITSEDVTHGFSLPQFGVNETLTKGATKDVEFVADKAGTFTFSCSIACGSGHSGMKGTLVVQ